MISISDLRGKCRVLLILLVLSISLGIGISVVVSAFSQPTSRDHYSGYFKDIWGNDQQMGKEIRENNARLLNVWGEKVNPVYNALTAQDVPVAGYFIDVATNTLYIGFKEIKDEYTKPIKDIVGDEVNLEFFKAKFTYKELRDIQSKIGERMVELRQKGIPLSSVSVDVVRNIIRVGLEEIKPQYLKTIIEMAGSEAPLLFHESKIELLSRTARYRPLFGGIKIESTPTTPPGGIAPTTLGFSATLTDGTRGFVMTGHAGGVGTNVYQPNYIWWWPWSNFVGTILRNPTYPPPRYSDAAFVPTTDVKAAIYPDRIIMSWMPSWETPPGTFVDMEGMVTGYTWGIVVERGVQVWNEDIGTLINQVKAVLNPVPQKGDSGAPIFWWNSIDPNQVRVCGILWGSRWESPYYTNVTYYSPIEGIQQDLGLRWGSP